MGDCKSQFQLSVCSMRRWWEAADRGHSGVAANRAARRWTEQGDGRSSYRGAGTMEK